ncbi:MAG: ABC transporter ATP-binding protein [Planctomycetes bacterium]|nr:ABC transporter ATP-binding protein [Planctomycetota bacterium]MBI4008001.1 ABC transporter ATP-binding protein [Planctomycetota bacterium]
MEMSDNHIIEFKDVHKSFNGLPVHRGISFCVKEGEILSLIGGSGSGKSVLLKELIGLLKPDSGNIFVMGRDVARMEEEELLEIRKHVGMLFQGAALFDSLTVFENIAYPLLEHSKMGWLEIRRKVAEKLRLVGLEGIEEKLPEELSGGMKKRVGLARAIATDPKILLYDEPNTGVDPINARKINDLMLDLRDKTGVTSIVVTHDMYSVKMITDRIVMLYEGRIIAEGTWKDFEHSSLKIVKDFLEGNIC